MTLSGGAVDPVTLRPLDERLPRQGGPETIMMSDMMQRLAASESEAAHKLSDMIEAVLTRRVAKVLEEDPEAMAVLKILQAFDAERNATLHIVKKLMKRQP